MPSDISTRPGRNDPCHCGSGKKYKRCCLAEDERQASAARAKANEAAAAEASESADADEPTPKRQPKPQTQQPWKTATSKGFAPANRMPRKIGGS